MMLQKKPVPNACSPPKGGAMAGGHRAFCKHGEADAAGRDGGTENLVG